MALWNVKVTTAEDGLVVDQFFDDRPQEEFSGQEAAERFASKMETLWPEGTVSVAQEMTR